MAEEDLEIEGDSKSMAQTFIFKPQPDNPSKGPVFLAPAEGTRQPPVFTLPNGQTITGQYINTNEGRHQWAVPREVIGMQNIQVSYGGQTGVIQSGAISYEGSDIGGWQAREKGSIGSASGMGGPIPVGQYGFAPGYVPFPGATYGQFNSIPGASYTPEDPIKFAKKYGKFSRNQIKKNQKLANELALDQLDLELEGLQRFAPEANTLRMQENARLEQQFRDETAKNEELRRETNKAQSQLRRDEISLNEDLRREEIGKNVPLKRDITAADNAFNQAQRTQMVDQALPGARRQLDEQASRAESYASGRAPDSVIDRALEISSRSRSADMAAAGGFGPQSGAARNLSDVMSAERRIQLSQYGDQLLSGNINQRAALELAPTAYSDAGMQVQIEPRFSTDVTFSTEAGFSTGAGFSRDSGVQLNPSVSPASLASNNLQMFNQYGMLDAGTAFSGTVQQSQFGANMTQRTQEFNAQGEMQESFANAGIANQFALQGHQYDVGYQGAIAGAAQTDKNTQVALEQQAAAQEAFQQGQGDAQSAGTVGAIGQTVGAIGGAISSLGGLLSSPASSAPQIIPSSGGAGGVSAGAGAYPSPGGVYMPSTGQTYPSAPGGYPGSVSVPSGGAMPGGYAGVTSMPDGSTTAIPVSSSGMSQSQGSGSAGASVSSAPAPGGAGSPGGSSGSVSQPDSSGGSSGGVSVDGGGGSGGGGGGGASAGEPQTAAASISRQGNASGEYTPPRRLQATVQSEPDPVVTNFKTDTGVPVETSSASPAVTQLNHSADAVLRTSGIYQTPVKGTQLIGYDAQGKPQFASKALLNSKNTEAGSSLTKNLKQAILPFGVFTKKDASAIDKVSSIAGDVSFISSLTAQYQAGDKKGFINNVLGRFQQPLIQALTDDPKQQQGLGTAFSAYQLYNSWDRMSPAQKGLGLAGLGLQAYKYTTGEDLAAKMVISPTGPNSPYLTVGGALNLMSAGYNAYSLAKNWGQLNTLQKVAGGSTAMLQIAQLGKGLNLLGTGTTGAVVPGVTANSLASAGFSSATEFGIGAISGPAGSTIPAGYTGIANSTNGGVIAVPTANAATAEGATAVSAGSVVGTAAGVAGVALGANQVYKGWGVGGSAGMKNGALGGASMAAGLYALGATNPYLLAGVVAVSVLGNVAKTGKHGDQVQRDGVRAAFQKNGLIGDDYNITLADGSKFDIGVDGRGGKHAVTNPDMLAGAHKGKIKELSAYDIDYTNDLDYAAGMGGTTLSRLISGGKSTAIDQMGGAIGNGSLGNVGYGKEFSQGNYGTAMENLRAQYAKAGIKSKADAYQLINQGYAEHRFDDTDLVTMQQAVNMVFDQDSYGVAQKLMSGRNAGIEVAATDEPKYPGKPVSGATDDNPIVTTDSPAPPPNAPQLQIINPARKEDAPNFNLKEVQKPSKGSSLSSLSEEQAKLANRNRYQQYNNIASAGGRL